MPVFNFPEDAGRVKAAGYVQGFDAMPYALFSQLPPGTELQGFISTFPTDAESIKNMAQGAAAIMVDINKPGDKDPLQTNNLTLWKQYFAQGFESGYRFCIYAMAHDLLDTWAQLTQDHRHTSAYVFAWNLYRTKDMEVAEDEACLQSVKLLTTLHKEYKGLN